MAQVPSTAVDPFMDIIRKTVARAVDEATDVAVRQAQEKVENTIRRSVAGIALSVLEHYDVERIGQKIVITVRMDKEKEGGV